jgi:hypothetical protein
MLRPIHRQMRKGGLMMARPEAYYPTWLDLVFNGDADFGEGFFQVVG